MEEALPLILTLVFRVVGAVVCYNKAEKLNRSTGGWTFFGIILPLIAIIWIQFMKPKIDWDNNVNNNVK